MQGQSNHTFWFTAEAMRTRAFIQDVQADLDP